MVWLSTDAADIADGLDSVEISSTLIAAPRGQDTPAPPCIAAPWSKASCTMSILLRRTAFIEVAHPCFRAAGLAIAWGLHVGSRQTSGVVVVHGRYF